VGVEPTDAQDDQPEIVAIAEDLGIELYVETIRQETNRVLAVADITRDLLLAVGEDPRRDGLVDTPIRVGHMWLELLSGVDMAPVDVLRTRGEDLGFANPGYDEMVVLKGIEFVSMCEHHLMPFFGTVSIAYVPDKQVVGVSKLARLTEVYARRLQIQERMTKEIADTLWEALHPKGVAVVVQATHMCMVARGVKKKATMTTNVMRGVFREDPRARAELLASLKE
jgi:GTP cyclohydrolase I